MEFITTQIIEALEASRQGENRPWIYNENGVLSDNILLVDTVDILNEFKDWEVIDNRMIDKILEEGTFDNTFNHCGKITNDLQFCKFNEYLFIKVHFGGDVRGNYSEPILYRFDYDNQFYELESIRKIVNYDNYSFEMNAFGEGIEVYDLEGNYITTVYDIEVEEALKELKDNSEA